MKVLRTINMLHPILIDCMNRINNDIISIHKIPVKLFETGREHERHSMLVQRGKTRDIISRHLYNLENDPPLYATAVDYVYYDGRWSWNLRDNTVSSWYVLFGNLVLDVCPELEWGGAKRKSVNYCHFQLRADVMIDGLDKYPCATP